ncbi:MAG TPA: pyruvate ferredoxin oxidoreductase [Candidatus Woesearchaeota archaeon]|nr:pyruvate ferredoxin oxidoreductase [Candidatus Woesearchaeota archaeon]
MMNLFDFAKKAHKLLPGHRSCAGCPAPIVARAILSATDDEVVVSNATGCLEVVTTIYPQSSWNIPFIHNTFENAAATISGVETAYRSLKKSGRINQNRKIRFVAFGGDGGTYDIGLQSLSAALERGHTFTYVCYDNEGYMNTGGQRSSATPIGANTTTDPVGEVRVGKQESRKDLMKIVAAHHIPYAAQASLSNWPDLLKKAQKALSTEGPSFLLVLSPCVAVWKIKPDMAVELSRLAVDTCFWPLYEIEDGKFRLNFDPAGNKLPIAEFLKHQGRYKHLLEPKNKKLLDRLQAEVDHEFEKIKKLSEIGISVF